MKEISLCGEGHTTSPIASQIRIPAASITLSPSQQTQARNRFYPIPPLTRLGGCLGGRALGALLALDALSGALGGVGGVLGLIGLLAALGGGLLLLGLLDGLLAGGGTGLRAHAAALLDHIEGGSDDGTLVLHDTAGTLLGDFLFARFPVSVSVSYIAFLLFLGFVVVVLYPPVESRSPIPPLYFISVHPFTSKRTTSPPNNKRKSMEQGVLTSEIPFLCWRR